MTENLNVKDSSVRTHQNILQTIGNTPLVRLNRVANNVSSQVYAKVEFFNPGGSVKDRIAINIIKEAEESGRLKPGGTVVEATSGNTGVGLAIVCAIKGYKSVFVMPDKMSEEKIFLLRAFGARVVITPTAVEPEDPRSYYSVANRIVAETPNAILANQYHNPENPRSHYETTGPEIWEQTQGKVTDVVLGMGTGGTITGLGRYLKEKNPEINIVGVDPTGSILLETWQHGSIPDDAEAFSYKVEGIGEDFLPSTLDLSVIDEIVRVTDKESFYWTRRLVREEGIFCGGSSGSALAGALKFAADLPADRLVVVILPDSGSRYLSKIFDDEWMRENGFLDSEWTNVSLADVLNRKSIHNLISIPMDARITDVISLLKENDISQVPVLNSEGGVEGIVSEVDLFKYVLGNGQAGSADQAVTALIQPPPPAFPLEASLEEALSVVLTGEVVMVTEMERPVGILTKIDLLDYIASGS
jgi:cystathionine beta-synthase